MVGSASGCAEAARAVDAIVLPTFAGQPDFEFERAQAWRQVAYARRGDPDGCEEAERIVASIVYQEEKANHSRFRRHPLVTPQHNRGGAGSGKPM